MHITPQFLTQIVARFYYLNEILVGGSRPSINVLVKTVTMDLTQKMLVDLLNGEEIELPDLGKKELHDFKIDKKNPSILHAEGFMGYALRDSNFPALYEELSKEGWSLGCSVAKLRHYGYEVPYPKKAKKAAKKGSEKKSAV